MMKLKVKKMKTAAYVTGTGKLDTRISYACSNIGVRHTCSYHCKKCYFEAIYCPK
jgi:hypothetical protein